MAASSSSSSSSSSSQEKYEVFLSFRGEDTRHGFAGYLYNALCQKHILTYKDDENLESGHEISEIMEAIRESEICVIVFSKDFASSTWCLDEVVRILECKRDGDDVIIPIFYGIEPSIVRKQEKSYAVSFAKHELRFKDNLDMVQYWRDALKQVADLSGYDSKNFWPEYKLIDKIVKDILSKLSKYPSTYDHSKRGLIAIENRIKEIEGLLCIGLMDVRTIGLYGMGGIGKTTLADAVFKNFYHHFESHCFLRNVREECERRGINYLREKLLSELFKHDKTVPSLESTHFQKRLRRTKVLIVLDDLDDAISQLNELLPKEYEFGAGSRIILTTRDVQLLKSRTDIIYEVKRLKDVEALKLFRLHAFGKNSDLEGYETLSESIANYADGNPLALEVLGSSLYSKSIKDWESTLDELQSEPNPKIEKVLRISFDQLGKKDKKGYTPIQDVFLDIACLFDGNVDRKVLESIIQHSGATKKISDLIDKCLVIEDQYKTLSMHSLIRQMGQAIVCDENKKPEKRTRLWKVNEVCRVLINNKGSSKIEGISLNLSKLERDVNVESPAVFSKMNNLRILRIYNPGEFWGEGTRYNPASKEKELLCKKIYLPSEGIEYLSDELRYLRWDSYPLKHLPSKFSPENLAQLVMPKSQLEELPWNENQHIGKLQEINLSHSLHLIRIPNLSAAIYLCSINFKGCKSLVQVPSCFKNLDKLEFLNLCDCESLKDGIENLPLNLFQLILSGTAIEVLPSSFGCLLDIEHLDLSHCKNLKDGIENLPSNIKDLKLCGTAIEVLPSSFGRLLDLKDLDLNCCENLKDGIEYLPLNIVSLTLDRTPIKTLPETIWKMGCLKRLSLEYCPNLEKLPEISDDCTSSSLDCLSINGCTRLKSIPELPSSLTGLYVDNCTSLETISRWRDPKSGHYYFGDCVKLDQHTQNNIIADGLCRIISFRQIRYLCAVYPGNEIPACFSHQTDSGNSIHIQLPPNWFHDRHFRFVFCAVLASNVSFRYKFNFKFKTNMNSDDRLYVYKSVYTSAPLRTEDHVHIENLEIDLEKVFGAEWSSVCSNVTEASCRVFIEGKEKAISWEIKKCGLELLNK